MEDIETTKKNDPNAIETNIEDVASSTMGGKGEVLSLEDVDPALDAKMHIVNNVSLVEIFLSLDKLALIRLHAH